MTLVVDLKIGTAAGGMTMCIIAESKLSTSTYNFYFYLKEDPNVPKNVIGIRNTTKVCVA